MRLPDVKESIVNAKSPRVVHVRLVGEFDISDSRLLSELLEPAEGADIVIVDMSRTTYIDLTALRCLVRLKTKLIAQGGGVVRLVGVWPSVRRLFTISHLDGLFEFGQRENAKAPEGAVKEQGFVWGR